MISSYGLIDSCSVLMLYLTSQTYNKVPLCSKVEKSQIDFLSILLKWQLGDGKDLVTKWRALEKKVANRSVQISSGSIDNGRFEIQSGLDLNTA